MARRRKRRTLTPRVPKRVKRKKRARKTRGHQHPELVGLALLALGVLLVAVLWVGWNGGYVGLWVGNGLEALIGRAALGLPPALAIVGALMVGRSDLVDVRPFRTGLAVLFLGLMLTLGGDRGGLLGALLGGGLGFALGGTGVAIVGVLGLLAGGLLLTGASAGAILRGSGRAVHRAAKRSFQRPVPALRVIDGAAAPPRPQKPPIDVVDEFPELVSELEPQPLLVEPQPDPEPDQTSLFDVTAVPAADYRLQIRGRRLDVPARRGR